MVVIVPLTLESDKGGSLVADIRWRDYLSHHLTSFAHEGFFSEVFEEVVLLHSETPQETASSHLHEWEGSLIVRNRTLRARIWPSPSFLLSTRNQAPTYILGAGVLLAVLFPLMLHHWRDARIRELRNGEINRRLRREVAEREKAQVELRELNRTLGSRVEEATAKLEEHAQELQRSNDDLENFAYIASHDLKSPLRAIDNLSAWLAEDLEDKLNDETREQVRLLRGRVHRMEAMIDGLLQYSQAGRKQDAITEVPVSELVDEIRQTIDVPEQMSVCTKDDLPVLHTQRSALQLVLQNLINNAIKHHDRPAGRVEVGCRENGRFYEFAVSDDGPGIPKQYHAKVFQMFQTLNSRNSMESTGMGLALVKRIVERMGGGVSVVSGEDRGTEFRFKWPKNRNGKEKE